MIRPYLMTGAAILALACFSPIASAQSEQQGGQGGGQGAGKSEQRSGPSAGGKQHSGQSNSGAEHRSGSESKGAGERKSSAEKSGASESRKSAQGSEHQKSGGSKSSANGQSAGESGKGKAAEAGEHGGKAEHGKTDKSRMGDKGDNDKSKSKSAEESRGGKDKTKSAEQERGNDKSGAGKQAGDNKGKENEKNRQTQGRGKNDMGKQAQDRDRNGNDRNKQAGNERAGQTQGRVNFTSEQRTRFHDTIKTQKVRNERINVSVSIGTRLPRDRVHLHALPAAFISVAPDYRRYRYALIDDRYCIVDPDTYEIVYIVDEGGGGPGMHRGGGQVASFDLSDRERQIVLRHVDWDRRADLSIDLALGADIPDRVTLMDFGPTVVDDVPKLRGYRYVVLQKQVAIIDPKDREVVLVIRQ